MSVSVAFATGRAHRRLSRTGPLIALCLLFSSSCSNAEAQSWQCRTPAGTFASHDIAVPEATTQFTGEMMIRKANGLSQWHPTAKVAFNDLDLAGAGCRCNGVVATWYPENPDFFLVSLSVDGRQIPLGLVPYDKPVTFKLTFARDGALKLEVGTGVTTGRSSIPKRNNLHLSCSTADVDFKVTVIPPVEERSPERCPFAAQEQWSAADIDRYCKVRR
ncbi:MAG: hypothetical protein P0Y59_13435 [Candidatus Sphingomonas phytovorans]|nr:hypothetical protein [Sphingomonas sp.]WEJ97963.1 MAG: hypothetical protein P0Y59_13435 [Sphingomonas sp.]